MGTYIVKPGDNLFSIAGNQYGDQKMFAEIMRINNLGSGVIKAGMVLKMPTQKPSSQLSAEMDKNLIGNLNAENKGVQSGVTGTTNFGSASGVTKLASTQVDLLRQQRQERNMFLAEQAQQAGTPYSPPVMTTPANIAQRGRGYEPVTRESYLRDKASGIQDTLKNNEFSQAVRSGIIAGAKTGGALGAFSPGGVGAIPGAMGGAAFGGFYGGLGYAANKLAPIVAGSFKQGLSDQQQALKNYLGQQVDPVTGRPLPTTPTPVTQPAPQQQFNISPATPSINRAQIQNDPVGLQALNLSRSSLSEQQLPIGDQALDVNYLQTVGMTPPQAQYYVDTLQNEALTAQDVAQFKYVFNIQPGSEMDTMLANAVVGAPLSNDEMMGNIYDELWNVPAGYQPSIEQIISGGGGGNAPTIGTGAGVSWGGY